MGFVLPSGGGGSNGVSFIAIRDRLLRRKSDGGDHRLITASGTWNKAAHLALLKSSFGLADDAEKINGDNTWIRGYFISGGGGGAYGSYTAYGGFPGIVAVRDFWLHELPENITMTVGAGGTGGNWGGGTGWGNGGDPWRVFTDAASRGGNDTTEQKKQYALMLGRGMDPGIPDNTTYFASDTGEWLRPNSPRGPGMGGSGLRTGAGAPGSSTRTSPREGGNSGVLTAAGARGGGYASDVASQRNGWDHHVLFADSYGAGGVGSINNYALPLYGNGGYPGGGGGSGDYYGTAGIGGHGAIKLMNFIREAK